MGAGETISHGLLNRNSLSIIIFVYSLRPAQFSF
jgi:hypothetical protein